MRVITLAHFSAKELAPSVTVDPADVAKEFAFRKDSLSTPERRTVIEIPVKSAAQGKAAAQRLAAGEDPALIAKSMGVEPVTYVDKPQSAIADRKLAQAAFAMQAGAANGPVSGDLGLAAVKVATVTPGVTPTIESARPKIETDLRQRKAEQAAYDLSKKFDDARQAGASVADAALKAGAPAVTLGPVTAQGLDADGKPNPLLTDKILKAAFAMPAAQDGDLTDLGPGEYFAVRVDRVLPPALPALADKRPQLAHAYMNQELVTALKAKANALMAEVRKGGSLDQAATEVGSHVVRQTDMQRLHAQQYQATLGREFLEQIFGVKPGEVFAAGGQTGVYIAKLDAVRPGDTTETARLLEGLRGRVTQAYLKDLMTSVNTAAEKEVKVSINLPLARQALNIDPALIAKLGGKAAGQAK